MNYKKISLLIPCRNEEKFLRNCIDSLLENDYPKNLTEILFIDGLSTDNTLNILNEYLLKFSFAKVLTNTKKTFPAAINIGIKNSIGDYIMILGAHAIYDKKYISTCVKGFEKYDVDNIGGLLLNVAQEKNFFSEMILSTRKNPFGAGNAPFRIGSHEPKMVDTVFGGCYKREVFEKIGFFNEDLTRSSDIEFNIRLKKSGGNILMIPDAIAYYYTRTNFIKFLKRNFVNGLWVIYPLKYVNFLPVSIRHLMPLFFATSIISGIVFTFFSKIALFILIVFLFIYFAASFYFSSREIEKGLKHVLILPIVFFLLHFSYGLGSVFALLQIAFSRKLYKTWLLNK